MTMTTTSDEIVPVGRMPGPLQALKVLTDLQSARARVDETVGAPPNTDDRLARVEWDLRSAQAAPERARLDVQIERAKAAHALAVDEARNAMRALFAEKKREALKRVIPALRAAQREMEALGALEEREHHLVSTMTDRFAWPSLLRNESGESFVDEWLARAQSAGLVE